MPNKPFFTVQDIEDSLKPSIKQSFNIRLSCILYTNLLFSKNATYEFKNIQQGSIFGMGIFCFMNGLVLKLI